VPHEVGLLGLEPGPEPAEGRQSGDPGALGQQAALEAELREHPGHEQRGDDGRQHTDDERDTEAAHRPGREEEQQTGGEQRRDVGVGDRAEGLGEAVVEGGHQPLAARGGVLLPGALEDEHVRVDREPGGQQQTTEPGQGERRAEGDQRAVRDEPVRRERDGGEEADEAVDDDEEDRGERQADDAGPDAGVDGVLAEGRARPCWTR
jgi:hypothetical protein